MKDCPQGGKIGCPYIEQFAYECVCSHTVVNNLLEEIHNLITLKNVLLFLFNGKQYADIQDSFIWN